MPKVPKPKPAPNAPTVASFITSGGTNGKGQRPNKITNPLIGQSSTTASRPSLIGGA